MKKSGPRKVRSSIPPRVIKPVDKTIDETLTNIHRKMVELYHFNFTSINEVKILKQSELLDQFSLRMRTDLEKTDVAYGNELWKQITETLNNNQKAGLFDNFSFYTPKDDILYLNQNMMVTNPEKIAEICAHELAEKLLSTYISPSLDARMKTASNLYAEARKSLGTGKYRELLNLYLDTAFTVIFKEGCCEMIALQTLNSMSYNTISWETELQTGYSKSKVLLYYLDNFRNSLEESQLNPHRDTKRESTTDELEPLKKVLRTSQIAKGLSYFLGYPLAKSVLEKYGISGIKIALEKYPPLKSQYFTGPQTYQVELEKIISRANGGETRRKRQRA